MAQWVISNIGLIQCVLVGPEHAAPVLLTQLNPKLLQYLLRLDKSKPAALMRSNPSARTTSAQFYLSRSSSARFCKHAQHMIPVEGGGTA